MFWVDASHAVDSCEGMIRSGFLSPSDRRELLACVRSHREDHGVARRANEILMLDDGESCTQIAKFLYLDDDTIRGWYNTYRESGWEALSTDRWSRGADDAEPRGGPTEFHRRSFRVDWPTWETSTQPTTPPGPGSRHMSRLGDDSSSAV